MFTGCDPPSPWHLRTQLHNSRAPSHWAPSALLLHSPVCRHTKHEPLMRTLMKTIILTLIVAWLSISCQALSNFHSCCWLIKRCSAKYIVSLAALSTPVQKQWQPVHLSVISFVFLFYQLYRKHVGIGRQLAGNFLEHSCTLQGLRSKDVIFQCSFLVSSLEPLNLE